MRLNECQQVKETLQEHLGINLTIVDGGELFLSRLAGVEEPETKRKIIGESCQCILMLEMGPHLVGLL
jgi:GMP synthase (glutamine-hydrolysing)